MLQVCNIVIVGGEGDLAFRKLYPALFSLHRENLLADCTKVVCFGRGKFDRPTLIEMMREWTNKSDYVTDIDDETWKSFAERIVDFEGQFLHLFAPRWVKRVL